MIMATIWTLSHVNWIYTCGDMCIARFHYIEQDLGLFLGLGYGTRIYGFEPGVDPNLWIRTRSNELRTEYLEDI
jgi:hypothetical protein